MKKIAAVLIAVCLLSALSPFRVGAVIEKTYTLVHGVGQPDTVEIDARDLFDGLMPMYPGEAAEFTLRVINDDSDVIEVTMLVKDISNSKFGPNNLARAVNLVITKDGATYYNGPLLNYSSTHQVFTPIPITFTNTMTSDYTFRAEFTGKTISEAGADVGYQNDLMRLQAAFILNIQITKVVIEPTTVPPVGPTNPPINPTSPTNPTTRPTNPTTITTADTTDPTVTTTTAGPGADDTTESTITNPEEYITDPTPPRGVDDITDDTTTDANAPYPTTTQPPAEDPLVQETMGETFPVPRGSAEFIDRLPTTGEHNDPFKYLMLGVAFMAVGVGALIFIGVRKKEKEDKQAEMPQTGTL